MASKPNWLPFGVLPPSFRREIVLIDLTKAGSNEKEIETAAYCLIEKFDSFNKQNNQVNVIMGLSK